MSRMPPDFWAKPFAHRGLHDKADGRVENSLSAIEAAIDAGYAIEIDVQPSSEGEALVFHDYSLKRLTGVDADFNALATRALRTLVLTGSKDAIPTLEEALRLIRGRVPVLIEIKDQSGGLCDSDGVLEARVCDVVRESGHLDACAVMSFNPFIVQRVRTLLPEVAGGLVSYDFADAGSADLPAAHRTDLADLRWFEEVHADFISYGWQNLPTSRTDTLRASGVPVFCWTIRSQEEADRSLAHCDQITFESFLPSSMVG